MVEVYESNESLLLMEVCFPRGGVEKDSHSRSEGLAGRLMYLMLGLF